VKFQRSRFDAKSTTASTLELNHTFMNYPCDAWTAKSERDIPHSTGFRPLRLTIPIGVISGLLRSMLVEETALIAVEASPHVLAV